LGEQGNFNLKLAEKTEEAKPQLEIGFQHIRQKNSLIFLRKRK
jgi:hypothetical protein